jgi:hypothetical protein
MAAGENPIPELPISLMAEIEKLALEQGRSVGQVLADAVSRYLRDEQWQRLKGYGRGRATAMGLTEADVPRLIEESRHEHEQAR